MIGFNSFWHEEKTFEVNLSERLCFNFSFFLLSHKGFFLLSILSVLISKYDVLVVPGSVLLILKPFQEISLVTSTTESCFQLRNHATLLFLISYCFEIDSVESSPVKLSSK